LATGLNKNLSFSGGVRLPVRTQWLSVANMT
jgi:hypothetical protein